ncbi:MAG: glycoside hydrolase family 3 N-terminal domain-containing protein [Clostridia bacterium]|nr:glycoside hydrolase family 3 N-terminal domain-containing protein [Clostridia bacterium]
MSDAARIAAYVETMSLADRLGQLVMFGFTGSNAPDADYQALFERYHVGNFMLYGQNIHSDDGDGGFARAGRLAAALQSGTMGAAAPLIGIDVEGGSVVRFNWDDRPASARTLGQSGDTARAKSQFQSIGEGLISSGISLNLAPVLDVAPDPMSTFLTTRIISSDAATAAAIGAAAIEGLHAAGCLAGAKHFPGHGGTSADSHDATPVIDKSLEAMLGYDLVPFSAAVEAGVDVMLVAHISYPAIDAEHIASQSALIIDGLLREQMGFAGVVMSDDFRMGGLTNRYEPGEAALRFLNAGGDLILCGARLSEQESIMQALHAAAEAGSLSEARINESVARILLLKWRAGLFSPEISA